ncbi:Translation machinery-associated protein 64 [Fulvia fulva]|uniref:Translation machinery-associated protein 64 n=1 Tax=Passalora fulva TaxID=5499 RepID=A0A9Q8LAZ3_PASFU|nr:Translation machinery-associated protein 64 [Fulvia fulva]KAK4633928.1 Translation machinery-associated protein 64 [Fulvia fulva]UJO14166.1 Translation machinery-associated protein 64 [Fulvia fulva]WPV11801.1 Translation machinery-associated protein 64 [Fulvia fulva]
MFKKKPAIKPLAPLRSSDRRKLADQIINDFQLDRDTERVVHDTQTPAQKAEATAARTSLRNTLLPDNLQSARFTTTHGPELKTANGTVYVGSQDGEEARILWFQVDGRMYPTVYTLWRNPDMVPLLHTPGIVVKKLQGGADLMTPGLAGGPPFPPNAKKGAIVAVASTDNPSVPVAVGVCEIDVSALERVQGAKGHAVENMHWAGDELWNYSTGSKPGQEPPEEIDGWVKVLEARGLAEKVQEMSLDAGEGEGGVPLEIGNAEGHTADGKDEASAAEKEDATPLTQKEIDDAFHKAFLYGIHHHKTTNPDQKHHGLVFPLTQSFTMSNLVQPFLPAFTPEQSQQLQIKKTSWKNIKKFVKSFDKAKIIKTKDKDGNETVILDIDFNDAAIVNFKPYRLPKKETVAGTSQGRGETPTDKIDTGDDSIGQKLQVISFFRPTSKLQPIFDAGSPNKTLFTPPEVRELITAYIEQQQLVQENNKRLVKLDPTLANSVFDGSGSLDKEVLAKGSVPRDALIDRILHSMASSYAIVRNGTDPGSTKAKSGAPPKVHITLETRSGNKTVTKVSGLEAYYINPRPLADELRKVCAGSTSVEALAGAAKKTEKPVMEVLVQGPQRDAIVKALEERGVDKKWIQVLDKTKGKKR